MYADAIVAHYLPYRYVYHYHNYANNKIIDLIVSLLTAAYSINCRLFFLRMYCCLYESTDNSTFVKNNLRFIE